MKHTTFRSKQMKKSIIPILAAYALVLAAGEEDVLFRNTFNSFSVNAEKSAAPKCLNWRNPSLELRAFPGVKGKGNAVSLSDREFLKYAGEKNLNPAEGTVSFWIAPGMDLPPKNQHVFCAIALPSGTLTLQQSRDYPEKLLLTFAVPPIAGKGGAWQVFRARHDTPEGFFRKNVWHKIDIVWTEQKIALYLDGSLRKIKPHENWYKISPSVALLPPGTLRKAPLTSQNFISFNQQIVKKETVEGNSTAYDEIEIRNRALDENEIRGGYEKYYEGSFLKSLRKPFFSLPLAEKGVTPDGKIEKEEWRDAVTLPLAMSRDTLEIFNPFGARASLKSDGTYLYAAFEIDLPPSPPVHSKKDSPVYEDDCFELHLFHPATKAQYQFVVNSLGGIYDARPTDPQPALWNSSARAASARTEKGWSAELAVPLSDLGNPAPGSLWKCNIASSATFGKKRVYNMLSSSKLGFANENAMASFRWSRNPGGFDFSKMSVSKSGTLETGIRAGDGIRCSAVIDSEKESSAKYPFNLAGKVWTITRPPGRHIFRLDVSGAEGQELLRYDYLYEVKRPLELEYGFYPSKKEMRVHFTLHNLTRQQTESLKTKGFPFTCALNAPDGKTLSSLSGRTQETASSCIMSVPTEKLYTGVWHLRLQIHDRDFEGNVTKTFRVPDLTFLRSKKVMKDTNVPPPWTPVKRTSEKKWSVFGRKYCFEKGPWPSQIESGGENIFTVSPKIILSPGGEIKWDGFLEKQDAPDHAAFSGSGMNQRFRIVWRGELWFDGMYKLDWTVEPLGKSGKVESLALTWKSAEKLGQYVTTPVFRPWAGKEMALRYDPYNASEVLLWHSGNRNGLSWWCKSDANWVNARGEKQIRLKKEAGVLGVSVGIISQPVTLSGKAFYTMTMTATPTRPRPPHFRTFNYECLTEGTYAMTSGWGSYTASRMWADDTIAWTSNIPRDPEGYRRLIRTRREKEKIRLFCYAMPTHLAEIEDEYDYFYSECATIPGVFWQGTSKTDGRPYYTKPCCQDTAVCDLMLWRLERMFKLLPGLGGIYHDICVERVCTNPAHGCGGTDAFGKQFATTNALSLREYLMRVYKLTRAMNMEMMNHGHDKFNPIAHSFGDCWYPGEEITQLELASNPRYFYCDGRPREEYQFRFNSYAHGMGINLLVRGASPSVAQMRPYMDYFSGEGYFRQYTTPSLIFDFNAKTTMANRKLQGRLWMLKKNIDIDKADFRGYWVYPHIKSASEGVFASYYKWEKPSPYKIVITAGNLSRRKVKAALTADFRKMGINPEHAKFYDLWNGEKEIPATELMNRELETPGFMIVGIKTS